MARLALGEALTNLVWAAVTALPDIKASVNWMYAAKMGQEGAAMYDAAIALRCVLLLVHQLVSADYMEHHAGRLLRLSVTVMNEFPLWTS